MPWSSHPYLQALACGVLTRQFKRSDENPYRIVVAQRESMQVRDGHVLPTRLIVENLSRHTTTEVEFHDLAINPPIDRHLL